MCSEKDSCCKRISVNLLHSLTKQWNGAKVNKNDLHFAFKTIVCFYFCVHIQEFLVVHDFFFTVLLQQIICVLFYANFFVGSSTIVTKCWMNLKFKTLALFMFDFKWAYIKMYWWKTFFFCLSVEKPLIFHHHGNWPFIKHLKCLIVTW